MLLDCRSLEIDPGAADDPSVSVLIINSNVKHELTSSEYPAAPRPVRRGGRQRSGVKRSAMLTPQHSHAGRASSRRSPTAAPAMSSAKSRAPAEFCRRRCKAATGRPPAN